MASAPETITLTPPAPVAPVKPQAAAGLVPISATAATELDRRADAFVAELAATDANSPEFGKKVDALANLGAQQIAVASWAN